MYKICLVLVIMIFYSCSNDDNDNLNCPEVANINFSQNSTSINISFTFVEQANSYRIEYGLSGFNLGSGTILTTSNANILLSDLSPNTTYDVYITSICNSQEQSNPSGLFSITTNPSECDGIPNLTISQTSLERIRLSYNSNGLDVESYEIEYGMVGFSLGTGTIITTESFNTVTNITDFEPNSIYDFYIRANCSDDGSDFSSYNMVQYQTLEYCPEPFNLSYMSLGGSCTVNNPYTYRFDWDYYSNSNATSFTISVPDFGEPPTNGSQFTTSNTTITISGLFCVEDDFYVRANCDDGSVSEWAGPLTF